jgi:hypothetical protein
MTDDSTPIDRRSKIELRKMFHDHQCMQKLASGELHSILLKARHCDPIKSGQEFCTHSQLVSIQDDDGSEIARAHQYMKPNGQLGASGMPDPFRLFIGGTIYKLEKVGDPSS